MGWRSNKDSKVFIFAFEVYVFEPPCDLINGNLPSTISVGSGAYQRLLQLSKRNCEKHIIRSINPVAEWNWLIESRLFQVRCVKGYSIVSCDREGDRGKYYGCGLGGGRQ